MTTTAVGIAFFCLSCLISLVNIAGNTSWIIKKRKDPSARKRSNIHLLSIVFSIMAYVFARDTLGVWVFIPAILDPASIFIFLTPVLILHRSNRGGLRRGGK